MVGQSFGIATMNDRAEKPWFAPKAYGYGAYPVTIEGWAVLALSLLGFGLSAWFFLLRPTDAGVLGLGHVAGLVIAIAAVAAALVTVARAKSSAPWRWRNGRDGG